MLTAKHVSKTYTSGFFSRTKVSGLSEASLSVSPGETVGIFGPSGSGKTTLANILAGVFAPSGGQVLWDGKPVRFPYRGKLRREIQVLYQHPENAFDPSWSLKNSILEPFRVHHIPYTEESLEKLLSQVGLYQEHLSRGLHSLSGGELQRAALARALCLKPRLLILDEPTSMLDSISQAQILHILKEYQKERHTAYILISHSLEVIQYMCSRCYFLEDGRIAKEVQFT